MNVVRSRPALVAALSVSLASTPSISAQTEASDPHRRLRPVLAHLDALFGAGDVDGYLAAFEPDNAWAHASREMRLQCLFAAEPRPTRVSTIPGAPREIGDRTIVRVHHELRRRDGAEQVVWSEDTIVAMKKHGDGFVATFEVPIAAASKPTPDDAYVCTACNYRIGGAAGWLCVPMEPGQGYALEAVAFWLVGTDVVCEISVNVDAKAPNAEHVARHITDTLGADAKDSTVSAVTAWQPPAHDGRLPNQCTAARVEMSIPDELADGGTSRAVLHVVAFGPMQHILFARGSAAAMQRHAEALHRLLRTYRLLETNANPTIASLIPLLHHTGGKLVGTTYHNEMFGLECAGPAGWTAQQHCGGAAFRVKWSSPNGSSLEMVGHRRPPGVTKWTPDKAAAFVEFLMETAELAPCPDAPPFAWRHDDTIRGMACCVACASNGLPKGRKRALHLVVRDELLLVFDARTVDAADEGPAIAAMQSLKFQ